MTEKLLGYLKDRECRQSESNGQPGRDTVGW